MKKFLRSRFILFLPSRSMVPVLRTLLVLTTVSFLAFLPVVSARQVHASPERTLTLMIYMCGSNLESQYGSASSDIQEILDAGYDASQVTVLIMAGGSESWHLGINPDEISILEIGKRGMRTVWKEKASSMGSSETLTRLLQFGTENYPAKDYSLILWDHGGGPMEGVCWDELFSMDNLTLQELDEALKNASLPQKLSWIGFDACLMSSAEVALAMSPYAEYMIASQETEPAKGWNYAFLNGIETDSDGAETGKRIVDCFFDALKESSDILTLACTDLSKAETLLPQMDAFFDPISQTLTADDFARFSNIRMSSTGFGKSVRSVGEDGYDLVDLCSLVENYHTDSDDLSSALQNAIVYSRSSEEGANGLSVYHPFVNKRKYEEVWRQSYKNLHFSDGYTRYLERFGTLLTGESAADWSHLMTEYNGFNEQNAQQLSLSLTEDQLLSFSSAQLMILENPMEGRKQDHLSLAPVAVEPASLTDDGILTGSYSGRTICVLDEDDNIITGPISFFLSEDQSYYIVLAYYYDYSGRNQSADETAVLYHCVPDTDGKSLRILRTYVFDRVSETYTNRIAFSEDEFTMLSFRVFRRPVPDTEDALPGFSEWESGGGYLNKGSIQLPQKWHLGFVNSDGFTGQYAMFQITDIQQNVYSSQPIPLENLLLSSVQVTPDHFESERAHFQVSMIQNRSKTNPNVSLKLTMKNRTGEPLSCSTSYPILNGTRMVSDNFYLGETKAGETNFTTLYMRDLDFLDLNDIHSIDFTATVTTGWDDETPEETPIHIEIENLALPESASPKPMATFMDDGVIWQLRSLEWNNQGALSGLLYLKNETDEEIHASPLVLVNQVFSEDTCSAFTAPHADRFIHFEMENRAILSLFEVPVEDTFRLYMLGVHNALQRFSSASIERIDLISYIYGSADIEKQIPLILDEPFPIPSTESADIPATRTILEKDEIIVSVESILIGDEGAGLALTIENQGTEPRLLSFMNPRMDGIECNDFDAPSQIFLPAASKGVTCISYRDYDKEILPGTQVHTFEFAFQEGNRRSEPVCFTFPEGTAFGASGGTYYTANEIEIRPAFFADKPMILPEEILLPDNEDIQPLEIIAPFTPEEKSKIESCQVQLCLLDPAEPLPIKRVILSTNMFLDDGQLRAVLPGVALTADDQVMSLYTTAISDTEFSMDVGDLLYFYRNEEGYQPEENDFLLLGFNCINSELSMDLSLNEGQALLSNVRLEANDNENYLDGRTNFYLDEIELAVLERRVFHGTDRMALADTVDYNEHLLLSISDTVKLSLVPVGSLEGELCIYYAVEYEDGSRHDRIAEYPGGRILYSN